MNIKDIIVKNPNGMYLMRRDNGTVGLTNKANATHYPSRREVRKDVKKSGYKDLVWTDLNKKRKIKKGV